MCSDVLVETRRGGKTIVSTVMHEGSIAAQQHSSRRERPPRVPSTCLITLISALCLLLEELAPSMHDSNRCRWRFPCRSSSPAAWLSYLLLNNCKRELRIFCICHNRRKGVSSSSKKAQKARQRLKLPVIKGAGDNLFLKNQAISAFIVTAPVASVVYSNSDALL